MELMEGGSLRAILAEQTPPWWTATQKSMTVLGIVFGMVYIHSRGIIMKRLTPDNVLFDRDHRIRITDFHISQFYENGLAVPKPGTDMSIYVAPELQQNARYNQRVDCYSFGWILYEIVVGEGVLSQEGQMNMAMSKAQRGEYPTIPASVVGVVKDLILRCWDSEPTNRPLFKEIQKELEGIGYVIMNGVNKDMVKTYVDWVQDMIFG
jgi:serine/threonine protein kinase